MAASPLTQAGLEGVLVSPQKPPPHISFPPCLAAEILQANDNLTQVINLYKQLVRGEEVNGDAAAGSIPGEGQASWGVGRWPQS